MARQTKNSKTKATPKKKETKTKKPLPRTAKAVKKERKVSKAPAAKKKTKAPAKAAPKKLAAKKAKKTTAKAPKASAPKKTKKPSVKSTIKKTSATKKSQPGKPAAKAAKPAKAKTVKAKVKPAKATRRAETAKPSKAKKQPAAKTPAKRKEEVAKPAAATSETARKVAKTIIQRKSAKKAQAPKSKPARPIAFTLDEALEIAESKPRTDAEKAKGNGHSGVAATGRQKKEIPANVKQEKRTLGAASISDILGYNPASGPKKSEENDVPPKFSRYYKLLLELRDHVVSGLDIHTRETLKRSSKEDSGDLSSYSQHMADAGTDTFDRDFALSLVSSEQDALYEIEDAIRRIKRGNYGICEITGKPIKKERLLAVPFAKFSVEGQIEYERTHRKSAYRGGAFGDTGEDGVQFMEEDSDD